MAGSIVGIDIGNGSCKIAVREQGIRLVSSRMPENVMNSDDVVAPETMAEYLKTVRTDQGVRGKDCALVLAESNAFFRHVTLPPMTIGELTLNLPYEFRDFIEGDPTDYVYDYFLDEMVKDEADKPQRLELYAAAAKKTLIQDSTEMLRKAGFKLKMVIPAQMAYTRLLRDYLKLNPIDADRNVLFVNIGYSNVTVTLFEGERYQASKTVDLGCRDLDEAIADLKGIDRYTASSYKESNFEGVMDSPECQAVYDRLCVEVNKVINFYNFSNPDKDVKAIYLLGGGSEIVQLDLALADAINIPVWSVESLLPEQARGQKGCFVCALAVAAMLEGEAM